MTNLINLNLLCVMTQKRDKGTKVDIGFNFNMCSNLSGKHNLTFSFVTSPLPKAECEKRPLAGSLCSNIISHLWWLLGEINNTHKLLLLF